MNRYWENILQSYSNYWSYFKREIFFQNNWDNYFWGLIIVSLVVWGLEILFPWRKEQKIFRKDFWMDTFYMFFNFFLLNLLVFIALTDTAALLFNDILALVGLELNNFQLFDVDALPFGVGLIIFFIISDFVQWNTHRMLHRVPFLWNFHKVHHSVKEMAFAAQMRYHWVEPIVYKSLLYIPIAIIGGFDLAYVAIIHFTALTVGHLNHANIGWDYGPLKYILNNPKMHIWHHSKELPENHKYGMNFGLTLSIWDYLFGTSHVPHDGRDIELGFEGDESFPKYFIDQVTYPMREKRST